jgi:hypothetical protein
MRSSKLEFAVIFHVRIDFKVVAVRFRLMESMEWLDDAVDLVACFRHDYLQYAEGNATLPRH